ncbi:MAG: hypothetical protein N2385_03785 [Chloroflexus sp.]|nr:hypothetical protein [Chloroflexus sp.]
MSDLPVPTDQPMPSPMPAWSYTFFNPAFTVLLRSPFHWLISHMMLILIFTGRKTGKRYEVVVVYHEEGGKLYTFSNTNWSKNFIGGAPVTLILRGNHVPATARVVDDPALIGRVIRRMERERGEWLVTRLNLVGNGPDGKRRLQMPANSRLVEFTLSA